VLTHVYVNYEDSACSVGGVHLCNFPSLTTFLPCRVQDELLVSANGNRRMRQRMPGERCDSGFRQHKAKTYSTQVGELRLSVLKGALPIAIPISVLLALYNFSLSILDSPSFPHPYGPWLNQIVNGYVVPWVLGMGYVRIATGSIVATYTYFDLLAVAMVCILFIEVGRQYSVFRAVQVTALVVMLLPLALFLGHSDELYWRVVNVQKYYNILPWFTNLDLLLATGLVFVGTLSVDLEKRVKMWRRSRSM